MKPCESTIFPKRVWRDAVWVFDLWAVNLGTEWRGSYTDIRSKVLGKFLACILVDAWRQMINRQISKTTIKRKLKKKNKKGDGRRDPPEHGLGLGTEWP